MHSTSTPSCRKEPTLETCSSLDGMELKYIILNTSSWVSKGHLLHDPIHIRSLKSCIPRDGDWLGASGERMRRPTSWHGELCVVGGETLLYPRVGGVCTNLRVITVPDCVVSARDSNVNFLLLIALGITIVMQHGTLRESG